MKFVTHKILNPAGNSVQWEEWLAKTAAEAKPGIGLDGDDGEGKGQVINTEGEEAMTNFKDPKPEEDGGKAKSSKGDKKPDKEEKESASAAKTKEAGCGKEMGECSDAGKVTEKHTEACPGDPQNPEPKTLINNDPNYQKGESTKGGAKGKDKKEDAVAKVVQKFQKVSSMDRLDKIILFASLSSNKNYPIEYVEAMTGIKVANLTAEEKTWFKDFWLTMYPSEYVDQMIKDR